MQGSGALAWCISLVNFCRSKYSEEYAVTMNVYNYGIYIVITVCKIITVVYILLQKRTDTSAVGIYKLYEENTH